MTCSALTLTQVKENAKMEAKGVEKHLYNLGGGGNMEREREMKKIKQPHTCPTTQTLLKISAPGQGGERRKERR